MKIACIMMQKNERELLDIWIQYHGSLFGYENLYIFDNGSDEDVKNVLEKYDGFGVNIFFDHNQPLDFENKGVIIGNLIKTLDKRGNHDFYFPLDCDEFLGCIDANGNVCCEKREIEAELSRLLNSQDLLMIKQQLFNHPASKSQFWFRPDRKCFFRKNTFYSLDVGFHWGVNIFNGPELRTNIIQFHFHNKPFDIAKKNAYEKLKLRVPNFDTDTMKSYKGAGCHLTKYFLLNEEQYLSEFKSINYQHTNALQNKFEELNIKWPYEQTLQNSLLATQNITKDLLISHNLSFDNQECIVGWVDNCSLSGDNFSFSGWSVNKSCPDQELLYAHILLNNKIFITKKIENKIDRPDVATALNIALIKSGFQVSFNIKGVAISDVRFFISSHERVLAKELPFGKAAIAYLESEVFL